MLRLLGRIYGGQQGLPNVGAQLPGGGERRTARKGDRSQKWSGVLKNMCSAPMTRAIIVISQGNRLIPLYTDRLTAKISQRSERQKGERFCTKSVSVLFSKLGVFVSGQRGEREREGVVG